MAPIPYIFNAPVKDLRELTPLGSRAEGFQAAASRDAASPIRVLRREVDPIGWTETGVT
jgi:hypothetical protein